MFGYRVPAPDEAMLISGRQARPSGRAVPGGDRPRRVRHCPFFRKVRFLTLAMCEAEVAETCVTKQGIALNVPRGDRVQGRQRPRRASSTPGSASCPTRTRCRC